MKSPRPTSGAFSCARHGLHRTDVLSICQQTVVCRHPNSVRRRGDSYARRGKPTHQLLCGSGQLREFRADLGHASLTTTQRYLADAARLTKSGAYAVSASLEAGNAEWGIAEPLFCRFHPVSHAHRLGRSPSGWVTWAGDDVRPQKHEKGL